MNDEKNGDDQSEKYYSTRDLYFAAALVTQGHNISSIDFQIEGAKSNPVGYFNFLETEDLLKTEKDFWQNKLLVEPQAYVTSLKSLRARIANAIKNPTS